MYNTLQNSGVLNKNDLKIVYYFLHQFYLRLPEFIGISTSHNENLRINQAKKIYSHLFSSGFCLPANLLFF